MRQQLLDLHEIQKIDLEIREIEARKETVAERLRKLETSVQSMTNEVRLLGEQREAAVREMKTLEGLVQAETLKIKKWEIRLSDIRNQREYLALSREVEGSKRANRETEEKILELMATRENIDRQLDSLHDRLAEEEVDCATERAAVDRTANEDTGHLTTARQRREVLVPKVPRTLMRKYEAVRQKRLGVGLVPVVGGCCQGCNMRLPPQLFNILQRCDSIEQCPSCQRIVFWDQLLNANANGKASVGAVP